MTVWRYCLWMWGGDFIHCPISISTLCLESFQGRWKRRVCPAPATSVTHYTQLLGGRTDTGVSLKSFEPKWQLHLCPDASRAGLSIIRSPSLPLGCAHLSSWIFGGDWPCSAPSASWCCSDLKMGQSLVQIQGRGVSVVLAVGTLSGPDLLLGGFSLDKQKRFKASAVGAEWPLADAGGGDLNPHSSLLSSVLLSLEALWAVIVNWP